MSFLIIIFGLLSSILSLRASQKGENNNKIVIKVRINTDKKVLFRGDIRHYRDFGITIEPQEECFFIKEYDSAHVMTPRALTQQVAHYIGRSTINMEKSEEPINKEELIKD
jgi:hypothetical protein